MVVVLPFVWGVLRLSQGLPMFGAPTVAELEAPGGSPAESSGAGVADDHSQVP
jgi:uncharacterized protein